jgi:hypothetical protein
VFDLSQNHRRITTTATIITTGGWHPVPVLYCDRPGGAVLRRPARCQRLARPLVTTSRADVADVSSQTYQHRRIGTPAGARASGGPDFRLTPLSVKEYRDVI